MLVQLKIEAKEKPFVNLNEIWRNMNTKTMNLLLKINVYSNSQFNCLTYQYTGKIEPLP